jgi:uncharacterized protein (TIGR03437 family)
VQAPDGLSGPVDVVVTSPGGTSVPFTTTAQLYSPAFFAWPGNQPVATHADYSLAVKNSTFPASTTVPAKPGEFITLWGTGFGPANPALPARQEPTVPAPPTQSNVGMTFIYVSGAGTDSTEKGRTMWALPFKDAYMFRPAAVSR